MKKVFKLTENQLSRLIESETNVEMESSLSSFESLNEVEKMKWKDAIEECIKELGYGDKIKRDTRPFLYLAAMAAGGIILNIPFLIGMGILPAIFVGLVDKPMIKKIIQCARNKRKSNKVTDTPVETAKEKVKESRKKVVRLTESQLMRLIKKSIKESEDFDDTPLEDEPELFDDEDDDIEDYGFDYEDDIEDDDFQNKMRFKERIKGNKLGSMGIGSSTRWDKESEKEFSPIKPSDLPLEKFLKSKYKKD